MNDDDQLKINNLPHKECATLITSYNILLRF